MHSPPPTGSRADRPSAHRQSGRLKSFGAAPLSLGIALENLTLTETGDIDGIGNTLGNAIVGNAGANQLRGLDGADSLAGNGGDDALADGAGDDNLDGGDGNDGASYGSATAGVAIDLAVAGAQDTGGAGLDALIGIENLAGSTFGDSLRGDGTANELAGHDGADTLYGRGGDDRLKGAEGVDLLIGGGGADLLAGGAGADTMTYADVLESTSLACDTISRFDADAEFFDVPVAVAGIDSAITAGRLDDASFDQDLAAAVTGATLLAQHAVLFTPDSGAHAGETFLVADANGVAGYQASEDFVFCLDRPGNIGSLSADRFV